MIRIGIVGVGTIGFELAEKCLSLFKDEVRLVGVYDQDSNRERLARKQLGIKRKYSLRELMQKSELVIEAASRGAAYQIAKQALLFGKDVMLMSAGGLIHHEKEIYELAANHRCCVYLPSGAVSGLDGLKSSGVGKIKKVQLTTRKPPVGFRGAPFVIRKKIDLNTINEETLLFDGSAEKAISGFPQNINISATLSLAGIGAKRTKVRILATPGLKYHIHEVVVEGEFGSFYTRTQNLPSKSNPKTSQLAVFSAVGTLKRILSNIKVGT